MTRMDEMPVLIHLLLSRPARIIFHWALGIAIFFVAAISTNLFPFGVAIVGLIYCCATDDMVKDAALSAHLRPSERTWIGRQFPRVREYWATLGVTFFCLIGSLYVFVPMPFTTYTLIDKGGEIVHGRWFLTAFDPFVDVVRNFDKDQSVKIHFNHGVPYGTECTASTVDGKGVRAVVAADLVLPAHSVPKAYAAASSERALGHTVKGELCKRFAAAIGRYALAQLPSQLVLESSTAEEKRGMNDMGVFYSGVIRIVRPHAYVAQSH